MKKLAILSLLLFLLACNSIEGESSVSCHDGATLIRIEGYHDEIVHWTVQTTLTRAEFDETFSQGMYLTDHEIIDLFVQYQSVVGITAQVIELESDDLVIEINYDYTVIPVAELSRIWGVEDFEDSITLSLAIIGLEEAGMVCEISSIMPDEDE